MNKSSGLSLIPFVLPINVFLIGGSLGAGVQFCLIRIQKTYLGWSVIPFWRELQLVADGTITGRTAISILLWVGGVLILAVWATMILLLHDSRRRGVIVYGAGCLLLLISTMVQYGPLFHGPAGVAIPIGIPALAVIGYLLWKDVRSGADPDEYDDEPPLDDPSDVEPITGAFPVEPDADNAVSVSE